MQDLLLNVMKTEGGKAEGHNHWRRVRPNSPSM